MAIPLQGGRLEQAFWIAACASISFVLALIGMNRADASSYGRLIEVVLLGLLVVLGGITLVVALIRTGAAYGFGLVAPAPDGRSIC